MAHKVMVEIEGEVKNTSLVVKEKEKEKEKGKEQRNREKQKDEDLQTDDVKKLMLN